MPSPQELRALRESCQLTLRQVADATGYNFATICGVELGKTKASQRLINTLIALYEDRFVTPRTTNNLRFNDRNHARLTEVCRATRLGLNEVLNLCVEGMCDLIDTEPGAEQEPLLVRIARAARKPGSLSFATSLPTATPPLSKAA